VTPSELSDGLCAGRVAIVTGAGRGIGREHALALARHGARVVVNDLGVDSDGSGRSSAPAEEVASEIRAAGGEAIASGEDVADWADAERLVHRAIDAFGQLDVLVNNAGILRDRMLVNLSESEWDQVIRVHMKGTAGPSRFAAAHWRERSKAGDPVNGRLINTTSPSGIYGNVGQSNYGAAKAGIAALTIIASMELARYGVTANAVAPSARTRMTADLPGSRSSGPVDPGAFDAADPANISPLVVWLASAASGAITGRVFNLQGGYVSVAEAWRSGPEADKGARWEPREVGEVVQGLVRQAQPNPDMWGRLE
jgi:NAD(P)-dependent dehydrogenase (short-subunit alcohol dehydrogenase family)